MGHEDGIIPMEAGWDSGPETASPIESSTFFDVYATKLARSENDTTTTINDDSGVDLENMAYGESPAAQLTRQQAKALEKELPVSQIMTVPENNIHEFVKAAVKEADSWDRWHCIRPVPPAEAERIQRDPQLRKRIITARCCCRDKAKGKPPLKAKARMVAHGHLDPDIRSLSRNAATPSRISEMLLLAIYTSGLHGMAFRTADKWMLWAGDATTAFLPPRPLSWHTPMPVGPTRCIRLHSMAASSTRSSSCAPLWTGRAAEPLVCAVQPLQQRQLWQTQRLTELPSPASAWRSSSTGCPHTSSLCLSRPSLWWTRSPCTIAS